jgi:two-component system sensor histidine kinase FlrB
MSNPDPPLDLAQLAEAFALFSRASEELSEAYGALQGQVVQLTERLAVLMAALPAGVVVVGRDGRVVQSNRAAVVLLGPGLDGRPWRDLARGLAATETPGEWLVEKLVDNGPARRVNLVETPLDSGEGHIVLLHDVTDAHRLRLAAERHERLAAMGEMVAGLAHQLRTPLAAAMLYTANLRQPELLATDRARMADRAVERLRHLEHLIRDMLLFARGECLERQRFSVGELVAELAHTLEPVARARQVELSSACDCGETTLVADRKALAGALTNLLENAFQAAEPDGHVALAAHREGETLRFTVADDGRGIDPALQARLFEPFFTSRAEGTGLGLAIARGVARAHGGDIELDSTLGAGSTFQLTLSLAPEDGVEPARTPR